MFCDLPDPRTSERPSPFERFDPDCACRKRLCGRRGRATTRSLHVPRSRFWRPSSGRLIRRATILSAAYLRLLDPTAFGTEALRPLRAALPAALEGVVALDGKAMRRAYEAGGRAWPPIIVSAWAAEARTVLGSLAAGSAETVKRKPRSD